MSEFELDKPVKKTAKSLSEAEMSNVTKTTGQLLAEGPQTTVRIRKSDNPKDPNYETVQINGYTYTIMKGKDVKVPEEVRNILDRAGII